MKTTYLIVPAMTDQAGQCRIVAREDWDTRQSALADYRANPDKWAEVGLMSSRGFLVCISAPPSVAEAITDSQPLAAGTTFTFDITAAELENLKLRDLLHRITMDASGTGCDGLCTVDEALINEANNFLTPD